MASFGPNGDLNPSVLPAIARLVVQAGLPGVARAGGAKATIGRRSSSSGQRFRHSSRLLGSATIEELDGSGDVVREVRQTK